MSQPFNSDYIDFDVDDDFQPVVMVEDLPSVGVGGVAANAVPVIKKLDEVVSVSNICEHYNGAVLAKDEKKLQLVVKFVKKMTASDVLKVFAMEQKLDAGLCEILNKTLMRGIFHIASNELTKMSYETLLMLLSRNDYEFSKMDNKYDLENALCTLMVSWFGHHPQESSIRYKECFNKLRKSLLNPSSVGRLTTCVQFKALENELAVEFVLLFSNLALNKKHSQNQRTLDDLFKEANPEKIMSEVVCKGIKVGDMVDAKDKQGMWYVAKVIDVTAISAYVSFSGWSDKDNEWITFSEKRLAPRANITNGELHTTNLDCTCNKCKFIPPVNSMMPGLKPDEITNMLTHFMNSAGFPNIKLV
ncbi:MAG: hypothetical protein Harvfovirus4_13 [Harvfovirus sp.]|uniref:Uncharacterized protein n=1 Tax=Harvfovirus sp. TaxID=2487768 RepID=A0A3G5A581_9VIRU|nr:MAG: hypothetical protein Harvfovirus4_13 [Harvfovirus sp.]